MSSNEPAWRKSSYSGTQGGNCVEVAGHDGMILVRDTKDHGHVHRFTLASWREFVAAVRNRESGLGGSGRLP
ncbi:MAG: DUF397 domain-containing protein [Streptosporangiaceae bacterium]|jgi:hypothetical protein